MTLFDINGFQICAVQYRGAFFNRLVNPNPPSNFCFACGPRVAPPPGPSDGAGCKAARRQGCRCSTLPQNLGNEEDGIFTLFPEGKNFWKKDEMAEPTYDEVLKASLNSTLLLYRQLISSFMI
ncbi:MAG: hypothetical protein MI862_14415 [Desulfobacterales bacterium]|nr:hypothetical protein [Desulfobacterales bacterium]